MSWFVIAVVAAALNVIVAELFDWFPWIARRLVRRAVRQLPPDSGERYEDEWLAELHALPGRGISSLIFAVRIHIGASRVRQEIMGRSQPVLVSRGMTFKHGFDRMFALVLLMLLSPLLAISALAVRMSSPGPVLFRQRRVGCDGRPFDLLQFRSMKLQPKTAIPGWDDGAAMGRRDNAAMEFLLGGDTAPGGVEGEDRRTAVGRFMRRTSIDELPQLLNVLRGDMSLIGPRPERPEFVELFEHDIDRYGDRHRVKSGITGWAQVHGLRGQTSLAERVEWDNYYIAHWSLGLDVKILLLTFVAMVRHPE
jgi:lipopolysaccharide/colanic/teichoic acid biosynthesis glycosyltransferase